MANTEKPSTQISNVDKMNQELIGLLRGESTSLTGNEPGRAEELLNIHNRYNDAIQKDYQGIRSSKDPSDSTYEHILNSLLGGDRNYEAAQKEFGKKGFTTGNTAQDKMLKSNQLNRLFTMGDSQVASYFLSTSSDIIHIYDEIDSVCGYFYQLEEANLITRDNVLRSEQVNEDISMNIEFPGITTDTSSYISIVKKALGYQNVTVKIRDHVAPKAIKYGVYYIMVVPYSEIGAKLVNLNNGAGFHGIPFYESTDTHALFGDSTDKIDSCMESVTTLFESIDTYVDMDKKPEILDGNESYLTEEALEELSIIKENLKNICVCEDTSIPDIDGLGTHKKFDSTIQEAIEKAMKASEESLKKETSKMSSSGIQVNAKKSVKLGGRNIEEDIKSEKSLFGEYKENEVLQKLADESTKKIDSGKQADTQQMYGQSTITADELNKSEDMIGCHVKLVDPRQLIPIKIFDYVIGYYYFENYDYEKMGTSISDIMNNQMNFNNRSTVIDNIVDSVLKNLKYGDVLKGDNQLRSMILNCILYTEQRDNPIRIKFVRSDYVIPWKTNLDEHDNGQPVMLRSLMYARLYTSLMLFYTTAIITKSTDSEFYYLKESSLDGQINNQISDMMDQLEDANIDPIQIANGNILHGNRAINKRYFLSMGTNEIKPFDMDVVSGQQIDLHNDFLTDLKKMAIGATGVPAVMVDYVDEIEYATMLGMANIKHLTRCNGIKKDFNGPLTQTAKTLVRLCFPNAIPDNILDKMEITLRESKVINNNMTNQQLNDNIGMCEGMVKTWVGGDNTNPPELTAFIIEDMTRQLVIDQTPSAPWELLPNMYKNAIMKARENNLLNKVETKRAESQNSESEGEES